MGARSDFKQLVEDFLVDPFFADARTTFEFTVTEEGGTFDPLTGVTGGTTTIHSTDKCFSVSSTDRAYKPQSSQIRDIQPDDRFCILKADSIQRPSVGQEVVFAGKPYKVIQVVDDALNHNDDGVTYYVHMRV